LQLTFGSARVQLSPFCSSTSSTEVRLVAMPKKPPLIRRGMFFDVASCPIRLGPCAWADQFTPSRSSAFLRISTTRTSMCTIRSIATAGGALRAGATLTTCG